MQTSTASAIGEGASSTSDQRIRPKRWQGRDRHILGVSILSSLALTWLIYFRITAAQGVPGFLLGWLVALVAIYWLAVREFDGRSVARDKALSVALAAITLGVVGALAAVIGYTALQGFRVIRLGFFIHTMQFTPPNAAATSGGALQAIIGTLEQVGLAVLICVPLGVLTAVFLNEVGGRHRGVVRMLVDAMSGVPSIVAGLFIYAVFIAGLHGSFSGIYASLALSILMLPTITRTTEMVLRLVPGGLREASFALGAPEWRTVGRVVLPTARAGIVTAVILGVARVVGETAPLILTSSYNTAVNLNPFSGPQSALPMFSYQIIRTDSTFPGALQRAWGGACVLVFMVLLLFVGARLITTRRWANP